MYSQVSNLFLSKLPCTRFQSVIEISLVSCVCPFSLPLVPVPDDVPSGTSPSKGGCVVPRRREDTHRKFNPATDMNYSSSPPSLQKGEGQLTPSLTFVQRYERLRESQRRLWVYIPRGYFNPSLSFSTKLRLSSSDRQRKTEFLTFIPIMTITTIYTNKCMDINVYSFPHRRDVMISNVNYLGQCGS